jgi:hypothetical protein
MPSIFFSHCFVTMQNKGIKLGCKDHPSTFFLTVIDMSLTHFFMKNVEQRGETAKNGGGEDFCPGRRSGYPPLLRQTQTCPIKPSVVLSNNPSPSVGIMMSSVTIPKVGTDAMARRTGSAGFFSTEPCVSQSFFTSDKGIIYCGMQP